jgi:hypothetical protein
MLCRCSTGRHTDAIGEHDALCVSYLLGDGIMLAGYIPSILAHYHFHLRGLMKQRTNPTLWGGVFILTTLVAAATAFVLSYRV